MLLGLLMFRWEGARLVVMEGGEDTILTLRLHGMDGLVLHYIVLDT